MKKIMFNDNYGLTEAVLEGRKTMTRRAVTEKLLEAYYDYDDYVCAVAPRDIPCTREYEQEFFLRRSLFKVGEVVAVAQSYKLCEYDPMLLQQVWVKKPTLFPDIDPYSSLMGWVDLPMKYHKGWDNKMFVRADIMPHQIRITNIRVERLQDISDEDCRKEGIDYVGGYSESYYFGHGVGNIRLGNSYREAFAALIDKISGKGTFESNPWVFVYEFELLK